MSRIAQDMVGQLARVLATEGTAGWLRRPADAGAGLAVRFLLKHPGPRDEAVVNAYGIGAQIITLPNMAAFEATPPQQFDILTRDGGKLPYVLDAVVRREVGGVVVAWTAYVKGKGA